MALRRGDSGVWLAIGPAIIGLDATFWAVYLGWTLTEPTFSLWAWPTWIAICVAVVGLAVTGLGLRGGGSKSAPREGGVTNTISGTVIGSVTQAHTIKGRRLPHHEKG